MNVVLQKRSNTVGAIDIAALLSPIFGIFGQAGQRHNDEEMRGQLQVQAVQARNQIAQLVEQDGCRTINGQQARQAVNEVINAFATSCGQLQTPSVRASCGNIVNQQQVWINEIGALADAKCQQVQQAGGQIPTSGQVPVQTPVQTQQQPIYNQQGQVIGYQPITNPTFETPSNTLPLILLAIGAVLLISR